MECNSQYLRLLASVKCSMILLRTALKNPQSQSWLKALHQDHLPHSFQPCDGLMDVLSRLFNERVEKGRIDFYMVNGARSFFDRFKFLIRKMKGSSLNCNRVIKNIREMSLDSLTLSNIATSD